MLSSIISLQQYLSTLPPAELAAAKSELINIFRVNPWVSKLYAGFFRLYGRNPLKFNNLQTRSGNFFDPDPASTHPEGSNSMAVNRAVRTCTHIKVNGVPCGSPALRGELFCYFHQRLIRGVRTPPKSRLHPMAFLEDPQSIQASLMETVNALVRNTIDFRRAQLILRALHIAAKNAPRAHFTYVGQNMVDEIPQYAAPPAPKPHEPALEQAQALVRVGWPRLSKPPSSKTAQSRQGSSQQNLPKAAPATPPVAAAVDPTHPKPPGRVTAAPLAKAHAMNPRTIHDIAEYLDETISASS